MLQLPIQDTPILALGDVNPDIILPLEPTGDTFPLQHHDDDLLRAHISGGGTVANVASGLGRLGIPVSFCGKTGDDAMGRLMKQLLEDDHVDTSRLLFESDGFTNMVFAVIHDDGERTIFVWPPSGAAQSTIRQEDLTFDVSAYSLVHFSSINLHEDPSANSILCFLSLHRSPPLVISFDMNLRREFFKRDKAFSARLNRSLALSDIIFGSALEEIQPLTGISDPVRAAQALNPEACVIARLGDEGALCIFQGESYHVPPYPIKVVDTLGAGDAFDSGFIAALHKGKTLRQATSWGNACAAYSITCPNARSCPSYDALVTFVKRYHTTSEIEEIFL